MLFENKTISPYQQNIPKIFDAQKFRKLCESKIKPIAGFKAVEPVYQF